MSELKIEISQFMKNMSCLSIMNLKYQYRCLLAQKLNHCDNFTNIINYFELMYCDFNVRNRITEIVVIFFYIFLYFVMFSIVFVCINEYYMQALKIAVIRFKMNEYLAGVIVVGVANTTPDFMLNLSLVRIGSPTLNIAMCNVLTSICLCGGAICFIMPFKMNGSCVCRDFLFVICVIQLIRYFIVSSGPGHIVKAVIIFLIYPIYLIVNIGDFLLTRHNIRKLQREIEALRYEPSSPKVDKKMYDKVLTLAGLEVDDDIQLHRMKTRYGVFRAGIYVTPRPLYETRNKGDLERYRTALHSKNNPKNLFLFAEFFEELNPIDLEEWSLSSKLWRAKLIGTAPVLFFLRLTIPRVNYEVVRHGWSKLLNCLQVIIDPFLMLLLMETMHYSTHNSSWIIVFYYQWAVLSLIVTVPLAGVVFHYSRTDLPPPYHKIFALQTIGMVVLFVFVCCWEMEVIILLIGCVFNLSSNYISITFNSISNALPDIMTYVSLSKNGYGTMAFGGIIGGSVFHLVSNLGAQFAKAQEDYIHMFGSFGETLYIFLMLTIASTIFWCFILDFNARRSGGIFLWCLYVLFFLYVSLMESRLIHDFTDDEVVKLN